MILTDHEYTILSLLRAYKIGEEQVRCAVKEKYPFSQAAYLTEDSIETDVTAIEKIVKDVIERDKDLPKKKKVPLNFKLAVQKMVAYSSLPYIEHVFRVLDIDGNTKLEVDKVAEHAPLMIKAAEALRDLVKELNEAEEIKGYIIY